MAQDPKNECADEGIISLECENSHATVAKRFRLLVQLNKHLNWDICGRIVISNELLANVDKAAGNKSNSPLCKATYRDPQGLDRDQMHPHKTANTNRNNKTSF